MWLIGLDSNGTISKSDLDFLDHAGQYSQKPLYIVLNKADLRPYDQLEEIMAEIADTWTITISKLLVFLHTVLLRKKSIRITNSRCMLFLPA